MEYGINNLIIENNHPTAGHSIIIQPTGQKVAIGTHITDGLVHIGHLSAGSVSANAGGDELVLESNVNSGMSILSPGTGERYVGLYDYLTDYLEQHGYDYEVLEDKYFGRPTDTEEYVTPEGTAAFIRSLRLPYKVRDYQLRGIYTAIKFRRKLLLSPTGSGKSLII